MPWTLYRHILKDVLKLLVFSTAVLLIVVSFAAAIRPYREGLLGASLLLKFVGYALPTMLEYVLPLTAAFSTTMVFLRLASENEILACRAAGMSYRKILFPMLMLGLCLTMGMFYLSNTIVPDFYQRAKETARRDVVSLLMAQLSEGKPFRQGDWVLYADKAQQSTEQDIQRSAEALRKLYPKQLPDRLLVLEGVAFAMLDQDERIIEDGTAEKAVVLIFDKGPEELGSMTTGDAGLSVRLSNALRLDATGTPQRSAVLDALNIRIPSWQSGDLRFFTLAELRKLDGQPELFEPVRRQQLMLAQALAKTKLERLMTDASQTAQGFILEAANQDGSTAERFRIQGPKLEPSGDGLLMVATEDQPIVVTTMGSPDGTMGWVERTQHPDSLYITIRDHAFDIDPMLSFEMTNVKAISQDGTVVNELAQSIPKQNLSWPDRLLGEKGALLTIHELEQIAQESDLASPMVRGAAKTLEEQLDLLQLKVTAQKNHRVAASVSCGLLTLLGTLLAMRSGGKMPLVVYFWSFLFAIAAVLLMNTGENLLTSQSTNFGIGLAVMWSGNGLLAVIGCQQYWAMARR